MITHEFKYRWRLAWGRTYYFSHLGTLVFSIDTKSRNNLSVGSITRIRDTNTCYRQIIMCNISTLIIDNLRSCKITTFRIDISNCSETPLAAAQLIKSVSLNCEKVVNRRRRTWGQILFSTNQIFHQKFLVSPKFFGFRQDRRTDGRTDRQTDRQSQ